MSSRPVSVILRARSLARAWRSRAYAGVVLGLLAPSSAACARAPAPPLTPEQKQQIEDQRLRGEIQARPCPEAMESARAYKSSGTDAFEPSFDSHRCAGAQR
jgi:hypothetical protein